MPTAINGYEGSSGTGITTGNSGGSGNPFDVVTIGGASSAEYSNTHAHGGTTSAKFVPADLEVTTTVWTTTIAPGFFGVSSICGRFYIYRTNNPSNPHYVFRTSSNTPSFGGGGVGIFTNGHVFLFDANDSSFEEGTVAIGLNQWNRVEFSMSWNLTALSITAYLYKTDPDAPFLDFDESISDFSTASHPSDVNQFSFGKAVDNSMNNTFWLDDIGVSTTQCPMGPSSIQKGHGAVVGAQFAPSGPILYGTGEF